MNFNVTPRRWPLCALAALLLAGCGVDTGGRGGSGSLVVSDQFAAATRLDRPDAGGADTVLGVLQRNDSTVDGRARDWSVYRNGVAVAKDVDAHAGDAIWWDRHAAGAGQPRAVIGSYPAPFRRGPDGKRLPVRLECIDSASSACNLVQQALTKAGVLAAKGGIQRSFTQETLRVLVGPYLQLRADETVRTLERGPRASGVYARPAPDGRSIAVLDGGGRTQRTLRAGSGLVAATVFDKGQPVWIVTGTDDRGVAAAASAIDQATLKGRFALAVADDRGVPLPAR
jgi:hypothetical protein